MREIVRECRNLKVPILTLYAFSRDNWKRPEDEVRDLMALMIYFLELEREEMMANQMRLKAIGNLDDLPDDAREVLDDIISATSGNQGLILNLALSYGGREDIVGAARSLARDVAEGRLRPEDINVERFSSRLTTAGLDDPDLLIRTSGEYRLSNFLLWQMAYTEIYVTNTLWPDFGVEDLHAALRDYQSRERRFGQTGDQVRAAQAKTQPGARAR